MTITKARFFSLNICSEIVQEECTLWQRFWNLRQDRNMLDFIPDSKEKVCWERRVTLYQENNKHFYLPIMRLLEKDMKRQNEPFSDINFSVSEQESRCTLQAIHHLESRNTHLAYAMRNFIGRIVIVECDQLIGSSSLLFMGLIILAPRKNWQLHHYMENIVHEMSHIELYIKQLVDPLVIKGSYLTSPFRKGLRPTNGVFHAAFVLARIVLVLGQMLHKDTFLLRLKECEKLLEKTLLELKDHTHFTPSGQLLLSSLTDLVTTSAHRVDEK